MKINKNYIKEIIKTLKADQNYWKNHYGKDDLSADIWIEGNISGIQQAIEMLSRIDQRVLIDEVNEFLKKNV